MAILRAAKRSTAYRSLYPRLPGPPPHQPSESWDEGDVAYLVFDLLPAQPRAPLTPLALFAVEHRREQLLFVRLITPVTSAGAMEVADLYSPGEPPHVIDR
ncbi:MAG: hypothetical protein ACRDIB_11665 [Ardenticatenaceae bacterium]